MAYNMAILATVTSDTAIDQIMTWHSHALSWNRLAFTIFWRVKMKPTAGKQTLVGALLLILLSSCAVRGPYTTDRDKTAKGAGIGALAGALAAIASGNDHAEDILAGAAIGAGIGAGVGAYMDAQEEKIARIPGTTVERVDKNTLLVHFDSDVLFAVNSTDLTSASRGTLQNVSDVLQEFDKTAVVVQGHTDSSGGEDHNQDLSERRAGAVKNYLAQKGIAAGRMVAVGYGESMPVADNETSSGREKNRRVDILLKAKAR